MKKYDKPLLSLVAIVKNEADNIRAVLEAAKPHVDKYCIVDTGSTDGTKEIIHDVMQGVPGVLYEEPFVDFSATRNRALELDKDANGCEFQIMISGDEFLRGGEALRTHLESHRNTDVDMHYINLFIDETRFYSPRVFRTGSDWKYEGVLHEAPYNRANKDAKVIGIPTAKIDHIVADNEKRLTNIWENHIPMMEAHLDEHPNDTRILSHLGASYEALLQNFDIGEKITYAMRAMSFYMRRLLLPDDMSPAERIYTKTRYLDCARYAQVYSTEELMARFAEVMKEDPRRPEPAFLYALTATRILPAMKVYELLVHAAKVAAESETIDDTSLVSIACGWKAHLLAARTAHLLAKKHPEMKPLEGVDKTWAQLVREHVAAGLAAGGVWEDFKAVTMELATKDDPEIVPPKTPAEKSDAQVQL